MKKINFLTQAAMIAALYVVLTLAINAFGLASGAIQVRSVRGTYDSALFHACCHSGAVYRLSFKQHHYRMCAV